MNEWNIQSRAHVCQTCEKHFADKEHYHTLLLTDKHELRRLDICIACWKAQQAKSENAPKGLISQWQGIYHAPAPGPVEVVPKGNAEALLRQLIDANDPKHGPACYILAVMLERKRQLKIKEQFKRDGARVFVYEQPKTGDIFTISDPDLQLDQLEEVQRDVSDLLANGFRPEVSATAPQTIEAVPESSSAEGQNGETSVENVSAEAPASDEVQEAHDSSETAPVVSETASESKDVDKTE